MKLLRKLRGKDVQLTHGIAETLAQLEKETPEFRAEVQKFLDGLISHYVFDEGRLTVAHAGMKESMQGRGSGCVILRCLGRRPAKPTSLDCRCVTTGRRNIAGPAMVVYGHTPCEFEWLNRTINIDTGCVFGGKLTALRYPEKELISVPAKQTSTRNPANHFCRLRSQAPVLSAQQQHDDLLDLADVTGKRIIGTRLHGNVTIREENAAAALEVMSRFAAI